MHKITTKTAAAMNSISKAKTDMRRQCFIADICRRIDKFCELGTRHHPNKLSCEPFDPDGNRNFIKHGGLNLCVFVQFKVFPPEKRVIRIPFPDSPWAAERMSSEIATMTYVAAKSTIPVPRVYFYSLNDNNIIKSPFVIMSYVEGKTLHELRFQRGMRTPDSDVRQVYKQISDIYLQLSHLEFPTIGALGLPTASTELLNTCNPDNITVQNRPLTLNMAIQEAEGYQPDSIISQGKTFNTAREFVTSLIDLSENQFNRSPDIGLDKRRGRSMLYARDAFHRFASKEWLDIDGPFILMHGDIILHNNNILFDQEYKVASVIDWEWSFVAPIQFLMPPVWLTGAGFGFMLLEIDWYRKEVARLLRQIKQSEDSVQMTSLFSSLWETFTQPCGTAVATALLHPDYIYEAFWGILFWEIHGIDQLATSFHIGKYSTGLIMPLLKGFMTPEKAKLLDHKRQEQEIFWKREQEFFGLEKKSNFMD